MWKLHVRTYELDENDKWKPILEHIFIGETKEEALRISNVHSSTDKFYFGCGFAKEQRPTNWRGITCYSEEWWTRE